MNVFLPGGTGLVDTRLSALLTAARHAVAWLGRRPVPGGPYPTSQTSVKSLVH